MIVWIAEVGFRAVSRDIWDAYYAGKIVRDEFLALAGVLEEMTMKVEA